MKLANRLNEVLLEARKNGIVFQNPNPRNSDFEAVGDFMTAKRIVKEKSKLNKIFKKTDISELGEIVINLTDGFNDGSQVEVEFVLKPLSRPKLTPPQKKEVSNLLVMLLNHLIKAADLDTKGKISKSNLSSDTNTIMFIRLVPVKKKQVSNATLKAVYHDIVATTSDEVFKDGGGVKVIKEFAKESILSDSRVTDFLNSIGIKKEKEQIARMVTDIKAYLKDMEPRERG